MSCSFAKSRRNSADGIWEQRLTFWAAQPLKMFARVRSLSLKGEYQTGWTST
jgi:hypothetical protein